MSATPVTTIPNRPTNKPVFDFAIGERLCRVMLTTVSNDGQNLVMSGWAFLIDSAGLPALDPATGVPTATPDGTNTVHLSNIMAGTKSLYDGWCKCMPDAGVTINADSLPDGWVTGEGAPSAVAAYGSGYYDTAAAQGWVYAQGELNLVAQGYAEQLSNQIDTAAKLATLGI